MKRLTREGEKGVNSTFGQCLSRSRWHIIAFLAPAWPFGFTDGRDMGKPPSMGPGAQVAGCAAGSRCDRPPDLTLLGPSAERRPVLDRTRARN